MINFDQKSKLLHFLLSSSHQVKSTTDWLESGGLMMWNNLDIDLMTSGLASSYARPHKASTSWIRGWPPVLDPENIDLQEGLVKLLCSTSCRALEVKLLCSTSWRALEVKLLCSTSWRTPEVKFDLMKDTWGQIVVLDLRKGHWSQNSYARPQYLRQSLLLKVRRLFGSSIIGSALSSHITSLSSIYG